MVDQPGPRTTLELMSTTLPTIKSSTRLAARVSTPEPLLALMETITALRALLSGI